MFAFTLSARPSLIKYYFRPDVVFTVRVRPLDVSESYSKNKYTRLWFGARHMANVGKDDFRGIEIGQ